MVDVLQRHNVRHKSGNKAGPVALMLELVADLLRSGPPLWPKREGLGKILDGNRHGGVSPRPWLWQLRWSGIAATPRGIGHLHSDVSSGTAGRPGFRSPGPDVAHETAWSVCQSRPLFESWNSISGARGRTVLRNELAA